MRTWSGYPALNRPLTLLGVERRWFVLSGAASVALWNTLDSLLVSATVFATLWGAGVLAWKKDPAMLLILKHGARFRAVYDPGKWDHDPWRIRIK
ncbi:MAG: VirB3 family type IV secretion system protein [Dehalococcoidia bacterium]|nr:VirB3 family type IV secretion system protein [Dehalococcoidia bacterium]